MENPAKRVKNILARFASCGVAFPVAIKWIIRINVNRVYCM